MSSKVVKYNEVLKVELDGYRFDSKSERTMYLHLKEREKLGEISEVAHQVSVTLLQGPVGFRRKYRCDFSYRDRASGVTRYAEVKGWETDRWKGNLMLWRHLGPGPLEVYKVGWNTLQLVEEVIPDRSYLLAQLGVGGTGFGETE